HLVGVREPRRGGEHLPGIAHGDVIAEELAHPGHGGGEVDGPEDQHPRGRGERVHENAQRVAAPLAVLAVPAYTGQALGQHAAYVVVDRRVEARRTQGAGRPGVPAVRLRAVAGPDHPPRARTARPGDHRRDRDRLAALDRRGDLAQLGAVGPVDPLDEDVDDPAAGQPDRQRVVIAYPV